MVRRTRDIQKKIWLTPQEERTIAKKIGVNINTVCRRINSTGRFYQDDIDELKEKMYAVWQLLKSKQSEEL